MSLKQCYYNLKKLENSPFFEEFFELLDNLENYSPSQIEDKYTPKIEKKELFLSPPPRDSLVKPPKGYIKSRAFLQKYPVLTSMSFLQSRAYRDAGFKKFCCYQKEAGQHILVHPQRFIFYFFNFPQNQHIKRIINNFYLKEAQKITSKHPEWADELKEIMNVK